MSSGKKGKARRGFAAGAFFMRREPFRPTAHLTGEKQMLRSDCLERKPPLDKTTFTRLVLNAERPLYRVARTILRCDADCEDAVQSAILAAYEKLDTLREEAYFQTWLTRILINECYRLCRAARPAVPLEEILEQAACELPPDGGLWEAVQKLPDELRLPVELYYVEGYDVREVAQILRLPQGTIKSRLARGREQMRRDDYFKEVQGL